MNLFDLVAPATMAGHRAQKEARAFAATVVPGHTYWSVVNLNASHPGLPRQALVTWKFSKPGRWIGQEARCDHMTAAGAWLGYGPLHAERPGGGLMTFRELQNRPGISLDLSEFSGHAVPAGV